MKLGIYGYGNIGKGVELACSQNKDVELVGIFTRRDKNLCENTRKQTKVVRCH